MLLRTPCTRRIVSTSASRTLRQRTPLRCYTSTNSDDPPWFQELRAEMLQRPVIHLPEHITYAPEYKLSRTLTGFLPLEWSHPTGTRNPVLPLGNHLISFNPAVSTPELLPDGTDASQSPGGPWVRRMWAGGSIQLRPSEYYHFTRGFAIDSHITGTECIKHVRLHGEGDTAKIFVTIERRFTRTDRLGYTFKAGCNSLGKEGIEKLRSSLERQIRDDDGDGWGDSILKEERNLVFLKERTTAELEAAKAGQMATVKYLQPPGEPDFSHTLTPNRALLFRFSALTFNAHLIHLDPSYARNVEGHRNLLVHGPLSLILMLKTIKHYVDKHTERKQVLESIEYRNLAPLYCDEVMRICVMEKKKLENGSIYDVWIEGPTSGVAVKGTVYTTKKIWITEAPPSPQSKTSAKESIKSGHGFKRLEILSPQPRTHKTRDATKKAVKSKGSNRSPVALANKQPVQESSALSEHTANSEPTESLENTTSSEPTTSPETTTSSEPATSPESLTSSEVTTSSESTTSSQPTTSFVSLGKSEPAPQPQGEIPTNAAPSETTFQPSSREVTSSTAQPPSRAYRRKRSTNTTAYNFITPPPSEAPSARLVDSFKPVKPTLSVRSKEFLRRARRRTSVKFDVKPIPLVRTFKATPYTPDPVRTASRHSRFLREGVRKMEKPSIRYVAELSERMAQRKTTGFRYIRK